MASSSNPFQSIQEDDQASPHPKKDSRAGATNFTDEEKVFVAYYVNFTNSYNQLVDLLNTQFPVSKHTVRGIASMVTHDTDFTSPSLFNKLYEAAYKESWFTTRAVWGEVQPTRVLATAKWSAEQRAYLAIHDTGKLSKANTLSLTAKFSAQFELGCTNSQIKKACGDINADPDLRDQLRRLATVYVAWYTDELELEEQQEKKMKKAKARKNLDSKKKGTGLTPEQAEAIQSELLASSSGASASASLGAIPEQTNARGQHANPLSSANEPTTPAPTTTTGVTTGRAATTVAPTQHRRARLARYVPRVPAAAPGSNTDRLASALVSSRAIRQGSASLCNADHRPLRASYREGKVRGRSASPAVDSARNVGRGMEVREWEWY